ncbi:hypothetical protein FPOAC2_14608 [Fusarium poae]
MWVHFYPRRHKNEATQKSKYKKYTISYPYSSDPVPDPGHSQDPLQANKSINMPESIHNPKNTTDPGTEAKKTAKIYFSYLYDEVQRLKDEEDRDRWIQELAERNDFLENEIQRMAEEIKRLSPKKEKEVDK